MIQRGLIICGMTVCILLLEAFARGEALTDTDRRMIALEALTRLKGENLDANLSLKAAALKVLEWTRGTPDFVTIVEDFHIPGQNAGLLQVAVKNPADGSGVEALRLIFASGDSSAI